MASGGVSIGRTYDEVVTGFLSVRPATTADFDTLLKLQDEVAVYLLSRGIKWNPSAVTRDHLSEWVEEGALMVGTIEDQVVGAIAIRSTDRGDHWPKGDLAGYVHDLMVSPEHKGNHLGRQLLKWAESYAQGRGRVTVRLDCDASNARLCRYYEELGYRRVGEFDGAALFEKTLR
jgi:ribosomal protein S18 acetylase RimI-like enzyme